MRSLRSAAVAAWLLWLTACGGGSHPDDAVLIARFGADRAAYDSLLALALGDRALWRIAPTWYRLQSGENREVPSAALPVERWAVYRRLFDRLDLANGVSNEGGVVYFHNSDLGLSISGSSKGLAFVSQPERAAPRCTSLDRLPPARPDSAQICYRAIGGHWFLSLDW